MASVDNQKQILFDLLEGTCVDYCATPEKKRGDIIIGANRSTFTFRNSGMGILSGAIARAVLPVEDKPLTPPLISKMYELESLFGADVFELHAFWRGECSLLRFEKGERQLFSVYPDTARDGILVRLEWETALRSEQVLTLDDVMAMVRRLLVGKTAPYRLSWRPEVRFNGMLVSY